MARCWLVGRAAPNCNNAQEVIKSLELFKRLVRLNTLLFFLFQCVSVLLASVLGGLLLDILNISRIRGTPN